ncbi:restriction endonuclease subunit S [Escherichia coli]|uniref:restriction endonuclease subunit S n=1 Tax=Escherichia coli TaxID=562 RepID=UPI001EFC4921|nr:restriction endonuclease subunit S [Escherichia coli]
MSELSYLEKLLDGVEVEWVTLGSMADIGTGSSNRQDESENGIYPFYVRSKNILKSDTFEFDEVAIVIPGEGGIGDIFHYVEGKYALHQRAYRIRITTNAVDTKFLYYFMSSSFKQYILTKSVGATAISIRKPMLEGFKVPIPSPDNPEKSLAIQSEIVRILDTFTALTAELTAELNMRKKQYNYYRDQLLSFKEGEVEWKTLEEVLVDKFWIMPATPKFDDNGEIPYITSKNISGGNIDFERVKHISRDDFLSISKNRPILKGDFLISMIGTIGEIARVKCLDPDFYGQNMYLIRLNEELLHPRYFLHFFDSPRMKFYFKSVKNNSGQGYLKANNIDGLSIPLPSIDEQQKIAFILDKFDTLTNSITEGLPREIELRQKQYEYYRDLLFSFPKPEAVSK